MSIRTTASPGWASRSLAQRADSHNYIAGVSIARSGATRWFAQPRRQGGHRAVRSYAPRRAVSQRGDSRNRVAGVDIAKLAATHWLAQTVSPGWVLRSSQLRSPPSREPATRRFTQTTSPGWVPRRSTRAKSPYRSPGALICIIRIARVSTVQFAARTAELMFQCADTRNRVAGVSIARSAATR